MEMAEVVTRAMSVTTYNIKLRIRLNGMRKTFIREGKRREGKKRKGKEIFLFIGKENKIYLFLSFFHFFPNKT